MNVLYFDCFSGASGDMIVGALVDLGADRRGVRRALESLGVPGLEVSFRRVRRGALQATKFSVRARGRQPHRGLREIRRLLRESGLTPGARRTAEKTFQRLCTAEAQVHRVPVERVHLHEVGAVDAIADVAAAAVCLEQLAPSRVVVSPLPAGSGAVECEHGTLPVPAPATVALLEGRPIYGGPAGVEMVTPTGAAILTAVAAEFGPMPAMRLLRSGHGAGSRQGSGLPNVLRVLEGEIQGARAGTAEVIVVQANIDDMSPENFGHLMERLYETGALEVFFTPAQMKKDRPGVLVSAIGREETIHDLCDVLFRESTTLGVRFHRAARRELPREAVRVRTRYGAVSLKVARLEGEAIQVSPEYDDCRRCARRHKVPLRQVQEAAMEAFRARGRKKP